MRKKMLPVFTICLLAAAFAFSLTVQLAAGPTLPNPCCTVRIDCPDGSFEIGRGHFYGLGLCSFYANMPPGTDTAGCFHVVPPACDPN